MKNACIAFIEKNFAAVSKTEGFLQLEGPILLEIVSSNNLSVTSEEQVYEAVLSWGEADEQRESETVELLQNIR